MHSFKRSLRSQLCGLMILLTVVGCAGSGKMLDLPARKAYRNVTVKNHTITGKDVDNVIYNHKIDNEYIHKIQKLGKFNKTRK